MAEEKFEKTRRKIQIADLMFRRSCIILNFESRYIQNSRAWIVHPSSKEKKSIVVQSNNNYTMQILIGCAKIMKGTAPEGLHLPDLYADPIFQQQANHHVQQLVRYDAA